MQPSQAAAMLDKFALCLGDATGQNIPAATVQSQTVQAGTHVPRGFGRRRALIAATSTSTAASAADSHGPQPRQANSQIGHRHPH
jgi:hypothetical protein